MYKCVYIYINIHTYILICMHICIFRVLDVHGKLFVLSKFDQFHQHIEVVDETGQTLNEQRVFHVHPRLGIKPRYWGTTVWEHNTWATRPHGLFHVNSCLTSEGKTDVLVERIGHKWSNVHVFLTLTNKFFINTEKTLTFFPLLCLHVRYG